MNHALACPNVYLPCYQGLKYALSLSLTIALCVPFMILLQTQGVSAQTILDAYIWQMRQTLENLCRIKSAKKMHVYSIKTNKEVAKQQTTNSV